MEKQIFLLPGGYIDKEGLIHLEVELSPLSGREEEFLADNTNGNSASLVTVILSRCLKRIGNISPVSEEVIRNLLIADRQYLLLKLRGITFGERVQATVPCPWPDCGKKVDIDFSIADFPVKVAQDKGPVYRIELSKEAAFIDDNGKQYREVTFRLPNGGDQEIISPHILDNEAKSLAILLERCIQGIGPLKNFDNDIISKLSPLARMEIEKQMEAISPEVDLNMEAICPECRREFEIPFGLQDFFFGELRISRDLLYREVHYLAYHYKWSEREIMEMPRNKRRKYIEVLAEEIERLNNAG